MGLVGERHGEHVARLKVRVLQGQNALRRERRCYNNITSRIYFTWIGQEAILAKAQGLSMVGITKFLSTLLW